MLAVSIVVPDRRGRSASAWRCDARAGRSGWEITRTENGPPTNNDRRCENGVAGSPRQTRVYPPTRNTMGRVSPYPRARSSKIRRDSSLPEISPVSGPRCSSSPPGRVSSASLTTRSLPGEPDTSGTGNRSGSAGDAEQPADPRGRGLCARIARLSCRSRSWAWFSTSSQSSYCSSRSPLQCEDMIAAGPVFALADVEQAVRAKKLHPTAAY